ncbi:MAG: HslU--HslV peptidase ATPase subunit [Epsilonproteobacteria bacterium]|nr:HslU--HslV peptidase ATPase subunit [Campylobacterota bacterium]
MDNLTPKEIVSYLDKYIIGQQDAKKTIAIALRNRWRRMQLPPQIANEITPKNILMIGSTGVGKTEIARRLAKMMGLPFIKVEASKYTEVGFVGRDVESMVRDLALEALNLVRKEEEERNREKIEAYVENKIIEKLLPPLPTGASEEKLAAYDRAFAKKQEQLAKGELDDLIIEIEVSSVSVDISTNPNVPPEMAEVQENIIKALGGMNRKKKKKVTIKEAKKILAQEAARELFNEEELKIKALEKAKSGIIFIDEIDKIAVSSAAGSRQDPSKEGVQRDLLPIVEGSSVRTKLGVVETDHILFIAAGAFHLSKPSDLIPELQGRFPLRVELDSLDEEALYRILTEPENSLIKQYQALLKVEGVDLKFSEDALRAIAKYSAIANEKTEDIGARRLHTVMEKILEDISFEADELSGEVEVTKELVDKKLTDVVESEDTTRYIL